MSQLTSTEFIKPAECVFAFSIPVTIDQFFSSKDDVNKNFVRNCCTAYAKYNFEIVTPLNKMRPFLKKTHITILDQLSFNQFKTLFSGKYKAVILVAHCENDMIEFYDGFWSAKEIMLAIPDSFAGVLDLGSCSPVNISELIDEMKPTCDVHFTRKPLSIGLWLYYYRTLFEYIKLNDVSYVHAYRDVTIEFINQLQKL